MYNLYFRKSQNNLITAVEKPFKNEEELEKYIIDTKEIFADIFILKRQIRAGTDIPDIIGVDKDNNIVIIENKNTQVTEDILPQILRYAVWAETNPDSIRAMWAEAKHRPEDIEIEWDNIDIRIIVLAPSIKLSVPRLLRKINYNVELIEVRRFVIGNKESILLNKLEAEPDTRTRSVKGLEVYDKEFYKQQRNSKSVDEFYRIINEIDKIVKKKKMRLEIKFNKNYMGFKFGFPNVFGVEWLGTKSLGLFFMVSFENYKKIKRISPYNMEYNERWKQAKIRCDKNVNIKRLEKVYEMVYKIFIEK